jgi:hypothetical protein
MTAVGQDVLAALKMLRSRVRGRRYREGIGAGDGMTPVPDTAYEAAVYFADSPKNLYQIRQWYEPLRRFSERHPLVIITRSAKTCLLLQDEAPLDVQYCMRITELERFVDLQPGIREVFYVNQNRSNLQMLGFPGPAHVHINHGESDKVSMASNALKAYDRVFIAGEASRERILGRLYEFDADHLIEIGRPQIDVFAPGEVQLPADGRTVVLYAPTWEGDRPGMSYSSICSHGASIVASLLAEPDVRLIFRPHPRTGGADRAYGRAERAIERAIANANRRDPAAGHLIDRSSSWGWQTQAADWCICDISSVAYDWVATGKPLLVAETTSTEAVVQEDSLIARVPKLTAVEAPAAAAALRRAADGAHRERLRQLAEHHFGDTTPGASLDRFLGAAEHVWQERTALAAARIADRTGVPEGAPGLPAGIRQPPEARGE